VPLEFNKLAIGSVIQSRSLVFVLLQDQPIIFTESDLHKLLIISIIKFKNDNDEDLDITLIHLGPSDLPSTIICYPSKCRLFYGWTMHEDEGASIFHKTTKFSYFSDYG
jgi:hypothetical protein